MTGAGAPNPDDGSHHVCVMGRGRKLPGARAVCSRGCGPFESADVGEVNAWAAEHRLTGRSRPGSLPPNA